MSADLRLLVGALLILLAAFLILALEAVGFYALVVCAWQPWAKVLGIFAVFRLASLGNKSCLRWLAWLRGEPFSPEED